jgi:hypothetical protein
MSTRPKRVKRTYNLAPPTVHRVRELSEVYGASPTQDGVVDLAVERLYLELRERAESEAWARAAADPDFQREARELYADLDHAESWPE